jgi:hypothetical protein
MSELEWVLVCACYLPTHIPPREATRDRYEYTFDDNKHLSGLCNRQQTSVFFLFFSIKFCPNFSPLGDQKKSSATHTKDFCQKDMLTKSPDFEDSFLKLPYLDNRLQLPTGLQTITGFLFFSPLLFYLTSSQIWLNSSCR